jgi:hypothetical protein
MRLAKERAGNGYVVLDLGSTNLTRVNGEVVYERPLQHGDELRFARVRCRFLIEQGGAASPPLEPPPAPQE